MTTNSELPDGRHQAHTFLFIAVVIIGIEAAVYVALGVIAIASQSGNAADGLWIGLFLIVYGLAQLFAGSKLLRWHTWARGPLVFTQLIQLGLAWGLRDSDRHWLGVVMAVAGVAALVCLLAPRVTRALIGEDPV